MPPKRRAAAAKEANIKEEISEPQPEVLPVKKSKKTDPVVEEEGEKPVRRMRRAKEPKEEVVPEKKEKKAKQESEPAKKAKKPKEEIDPPAKKENKSKTTKETKPKKASKKKVVDEELDEEEEEPEAKSKKSAPRSKKASGEKKAAPSNSTETEWESIDFACNVKNAKGQFHNLKITSWNVDGLRACIKKGGWNIFEHDKPDILCLQETKCKENQLPEEAGEVEGYRSYWCSSKKDGYAGVAVYSKIEPMNVMYGIGDEEHDNEGRCITLEYQEFFLINVYVPNAGRGLVTLPKRLEWNRAFKAYTKGLDKKKPVIVCGDMNVAHNEIDLANPKTNKKNAGFTQEERDGLTDFLEDGYVDSFREIYPDDKDVYTFWSYMSKARSKNIGWRLDYFIVSNRLMEKVCDQTVRKEVLGSDHCPISLFIRI